MQIQTHTELKTITHSHIMHVRQQLLEMQGFKCAICAKILPDGNDIGSVDHQHLFKSEELGVQGAGLIRGVLCRDCNVLEGKFWNACHRYGKTAPEDPVGSRVDWLLRLAEYYQDNYSLKDAVVHPRENRVPKLQKSEYNRLIKFWKSQTTSYKKNGELKPQPKFTGRCNPTLLKLKESMDNVNIQTSQT